MALFWGLRSQNHFLGDGFYRIGELAEGHVNLRSADFLDLYVHREAWRALRAMGVADPAVAYALTSVLAGGLWAALLPALARVVVPRTELQWVVPAVLLAAGSVQLFFGYVECYTLRELLIASYILLALRAIRGGAIWPPIAVLALGSCVHLTMLALAPSLAAVLVRARVAEFSGRRLAALCAGVACAGAAALAALYHLRHQYGGLDALLPPSANGERAYGLFSPAHLGDLANHILLAAPAAFLLLPAGLAWRRLAIARHLTAAGNGRRIPAGPRELFWLLAAGGPLAFVAVLNAKLGARDWDLLALPATPLALAAIALLMGSGAPAPKASRSRGSRGRGGTALDPRAAFAAVCVALSLLHTVPWILVNHDRNRAILMLRDMVERDPHHLAGPDPRILNFGVQLNWNGYPAEARRYLLRAVALRPESYWAHYNLGTLEMEQGNLEAALFAMRRAAALDPSDFPAATQLGVIYGQMQRYAEAETELRRAVGIDPGQADGWWNLGLCLFRQGRHAEAIPALEEAARRNPRRADIPYQIALAARALGDGERARAACRAAAAIDPGGPIGGNARKMLRQLESGRNP